MDRSQKKKDKSLGGISIRFIAGDETVEDVSEKLSLVANEETNDAENNWTKDFLQAGSTIFGSSSRKRSGSMDSSASSTGNSTSESIGTWKLIKGKVVQAVEDIKLQKDKDSSNNQGKKDSSMASSDLEIDDFADILTNRNDTGLETPTGGIDSADEDSDTTSESSSAKSLIRKSIEKMNQKRTKRTPSGTPDKKSSIISRLGRNIVNEDAEKSSSFSEKKLSSSPSTSLLSKFGSRKTKTGDIGDDGGENTILNAFLKSRKKETITEKTPPPKKRSVEVEDGVEIFEDMSISTFSDGATEVNPLQPMPTTFPKTVVDTKLVKQTEALISVSRLKDFIYEHQMKLSAVLVGIFSVLYFDVPPFLLGFLTCLVLMIYGNKTYNWILMTYCPEEGQTKIREQVMAEISNICEIPGVIEHKSLRSYSGWMHETTSYDPDTFHMSLIRNAVFVKLDGSLLRISTAGTRIKRTMLYNDTIDTSTIDFIQHKIYNLEDAKIEMSPKKLARKRYFSRKYPILLTIPRETNVDEKRWTDSKQNSEEDSQSTEYSDVDKIYLFAIRDREKEDWFRRFLTASAGKNFDSDFPPEFLTLMGKKKDAPETPATEFDSSRIFSMVETEFSKSDDKPDDEDVAADFAMLDRTALNETSDNFHIRASASRLSTEFLNFMGTYQHANNKFLASACSKASNPNLKSPPPNSKFYRILDVKTNNNLSPPQSPTVRNSFLKNFQLSKTRPDKKLDVNKPDDLEEAQPDHEKCEHEQVQGFAMSITVGWANVLLGRVLYGCTHDPKIMENIRDFLQKKLSVLKLPGFMEEVNVAEIQLGDKPPIIQSISSPALDESGLWIDFDLTYEGLVEITITTKLNLMRLKRQQLSNDATSQASLAPQPTPNTQSSVSPSPSVINRSSCLYDSDAESSGSSSESESSSIGNQLYMSYDIANVSTANPDGAVLLNRAATDASGSSGSSKRFLRIVDRITASNIFQSATELSYVQNAFKNMNTKIQLKLQLKSLLGRLVVNVPPAPSDRVWLAFRAPPKIELNAKPTLGSNVVDWSLVTNLIENKLYEEVCKYLVFPNMVDVILPVLGESTYKE